MSNEIDNDDLKTGHDDGDLEEGSEAFVIYKKSVVQAVDIYLGEEIEDDRGKYSKLLNMLSGLSPATAVNIHLACYGGSTHQGFQLCHAVKNCKAQTNIIVESNCYSMGAILALSGKSLTMLGGTYLMFHNYSGHFFGKGGEQSMRVKEFNKHFKSTLEYFCAPFLIKDEIVRLINDGDVYVHAESSGTKSRIKRHFKGK